MGIEITRQESSLFHAKFVFQIKKDTGKTNSRQSNSCNEKVPKGWQENHS